MYTALTNRSKQVVKKEMTFLERMYIPAILGGLVITLKHFFARKATIRYPEVKRSFSSFWRGQHLGKGSRGGGDAPEGDADEGDDEATCVAHVATSFELNLASDAQGGDCWTTPSEAVLFGGFLAAARTVSVTVWSFRNPAQG